MLLPLQTLTASLTLARQGNASTEPPSDADASLTALRWILRSKKTEGVCGINGYCKHHLNNGSKRSTQAFPSGGRGIVFRLRNTCGLRCPEDRDYILQKPSVFFGRGDPSPTNLCSYRLSAKAFCNTSSASFLGTFPSRGRLTYASPLLPKRTPILVGEGLAPPVRNVYCKLHLHDIRKRFN